MLLLTTALLGSYSKGYLAARSIFSPGAFTVCCTCNHPRIIGFVVLDRAEGPLVLLNVLVAFLLFSLSTWFTILPVARLDVQF